MAAGSLGRNEEVSVQDRITEIINIFMRGPGSANLSMNINDGVCDMRLTFRLGSNREDHISSQYANQTSQPNKNHKGKRKSPSQRARDHRRAEAFRTRKTKESRIIFPLSEQLLPLRKADVVQPRGHSAVTEKNPPPGVNLPPDPPETPLKKRFVSKQPYNDVNSARKTLFSVADISSKTPDKTEMQVNGRHQPTQYQKREEELWSKLFN